MPSILILRLAGPPALIFHWSFTIAPSFLPASRALYSRPVRRYFIERLGFMVVHTFTPHDRSPLCILVLSQLANWQPLSCMIQLVFIIPSFPTYHNEHFFWAFLLVFWHVFAGFAGFSLHGLGARHVCWGFPYPSNEGLFCFFGTLAFSVQPTPEATQ